MRGGGSLPHCSTWMSVLYVCVCACLCLSDRHLMNECVIRHLWRQDFVRVFDVERQKDRGERETVCAY